MAANAALRYASSMLELDVRVLPAPQKHPTIHAMLEHLSRGEALRITNDHDPRPLRFELDHDYPNTYRFDYLEAGPQTWVVDIVRDSKNAVRDEAAHAKSSCAPDLRTGVPRSGRFMLGHYAWLARLADKVRAKQAETVGEYEAFCPISLGFLDRLNVSLAKFSSLIADGNTDEQLVAFLDARTNDKQRASANRWVLVDNAEDLRRQDSEEGRSPEFAGPITFFDRDSPTVATSAAQAHWTGDVKHGFGTLSLGSGTYSGTYSFASRFERAPGTNPEELLAGAHAACFSMAFSLLLGKAGYPPKGITTTADVTIEAAGEGFQISASALNTIADVPGIGDDTFQQLANVAKAECPVSKALSGTTITLRARLFSSG